MSVLVVTGPICAGKSTASAALASTRTTTTALVDLDAVRYQIRSGGLNPLAEVPPSEEALAQWSLAIDVAAGAARRYDDAGVACVLDAPGVYPDAAIDWAPFRHERWRQALDGLDWRLAVVLPPLPTILERAAARPDERRPPDVVLEVIHGLMAQWVGVDGVTVVDTAATGLDGTVAALAPLLA